MLLTRQNRSRRSEEVQVLSFFLSFNPKAIPRSNPDMKKAKIRMEQIGSERGGRTRGGVGREGNLTTARKGQGNKRATLNTIHKKPTRISIHKIILTSTTLLKYLEQTFCYIFITFQEFDFFCAAK